MDITWYGHSCFRLIERGKAAVVCDPYANGALGYILPKLRADIITISHDAPGHAKTEGWPDNTHILSGPGEYEIGDVFVIGLDMYDVNAATPRRNVAYLVDFDGINVVHLGDLNYIPSQSDVEVLGAVDVLLIPVGGGNALNAGRASEVISLIEPSIVVPMHYKTPQTTAELDEVDRFLKVMGVSKAQEEDSLRVTSSNITDQTQIVVLQPQQ